MKPINKDILKEISLKLMFEMKEEQYDTLLKEFDLIIKQMNLIGEIKGVDDVEPMTFPFDVTNDYLREDKVEDNLSQEEALKNSKSIENGQIVLPKVV